MMEEDEKRREDEEIPPQEEQGSLPAEESNTPVEEDNALTEEEDLEDELYEEEDDEEDELVGNPEAGTEVSTINLGGVPDGKKKRRKREFPVSKLPLLMRKTYSEKALRRHILKKLYIPEDQRAVAALVVKGANPKKPEFYAIPADGMFTKMEFKRYTLLGKEVKKQSKARVRMIPLLALLVLLFGSVAAVIAFKNEIVKKGLISLCEGIFQAKTDVESVDVKILDASITVNGLQVGNMNRVM